MKQFLKFTLATIVGVIIVSVLGIFILFGFVGAIVSSADTPTVLKANSVYQLDLSGSLVERSAEDPFELLMGSMSGIQTATIGLDDVLKNIEKAANDNNISGIYLKAGSLSGGYASVKEIRDALLEFKKTGKFLIAYADNYTQRTYYLCSVADKVLVNPQGMLEWQGIATQTAFYKGALDKLGVEMQIVRVGTFKSAVEPYTSTKMSDANREQVGVYIGSIWQNLLTGVSEARNIPVEKLNEYADEMLSFQPVEKTLAYRFVDSLVYASEVDGIIKEHLSIDTDKDVNYVKHSAMNKLIENTKYDKNKVAVVYAVGAIDYPGEEGIQSDKLVETLQKVGKDDGIKSVVLRVNSPGGSAYGSEQIWHAVNELKKKKTVIVSMGDYAASGGYYIACIADSIVAQPNTITGSIGIFGQIPNIKGLTDKLGVTFDGVKTNKMSDAISFNRSFTPEERNLMQNYVNQGYELFIKRCADGRGATLDEIKKVAEGRVWTGVDAKARGLVDVLGGLSDAVEIAAGKANLDSYRVVSYPEKEDFATKLLKAMQGDVQAKIVKAYLGENYNMIQAIKNVEQLDFIQARLPYDISIN